MSDDKKEKHEPRPETTGTDGNNMDPGPGGPAASSNGGQGKPISPEKLAANRKNGSRSNGPTTPEGKARSSQNSYKHGFFARQSLPPGEAGAQLWQKYKDLAAGIWDYYQPVGYMEGLLTEKIATESIRFSRLVAYESKFIGGLRDFDWNGVDRILRFQGTINRQLFQAIRELERLQDKRRGKVTPPDGPDNVEGGSTGSPAVDNANQGPEERSTLEEASGNEMGEVPPVSQWEPIPLIPPPTRSEGGQASQPSPQGTNYGTNPTPASSKQPGHPAPAKPPRPAPPSLAERATKVLGLPPMESPAEKASATSEQGGRIEQQDNDNKDDIPDRSKFVAPGDEALFKEVQESIREEENRRLDDPKDSS